MKKVFKKILSIILTVCMLLTIVPLSGFVGLKWPEWKIGDFFCKTFLPKAEAVTYSGSCGENVNWLFDELTGKLTVSGSGKMTNYSRNFDIPWYSCKDNINTVEIKKGVENIGSHVFWECSNLTSITIPDSVTSINSGAFDDCNCLTNITIPDSVTSIGISAFENCSSLTSITIPNGVTSIGSSAFKNCSSLKAITVNESNAYYSSDSYGVLYNKNKTQLIQYPAGNAHMSFTIPESVTTVWNKAFEFCSNLKYITIPGSVRSIGSSAFWHCSSLTSITVDQSNQYYSSDSYGVLYNKTKTELVHYPTGNKCASYTILDSTTSIRGWAFENCCYLTDITIPDSVTSISDYLFYDCSSLTSITIPDTVMSIGYEAFRGCSSLTNIIIPDNVTSIADWAFRDCSGLTSVTLPSNITSISNYMFYGCCSLTSITIPDSVTSIGKCAFEDCSSLINVTIPNNVIYIGYSSFWGCSSLTSITIPDGVMNISNSLFEGCSKLTSITIPDSVTSIDIFAFDSCKGLTDVYYTGSEEQWKAISIAAYNEYLTNATIHYNTSNPETKSNVFYEKAYIAKEWFSSGGVESNLVEMFISYWPDYCQELCLACDKSGLDTAKAILDGMDWILDPADTAKSKTLDAVSAREMMVLKLIYNTIMGDQYKKNLLSEVTSKANDIRSYYSDITSPLDLEDVFDDEKSAKTFMEVFNKTSESPTKLNASIALAKDLIKICKDVAQFAEKMSLYLAVASATSDLLDSLLLIRENCKDNNTKRAITNVVNTLDSDSTNEIIIRAVGDGVINISSDLAVSLTDTLLNCVPIYRELRAFYSVGKNVLNAITGSDDVIGAYKTSYITADLLSASEAATRSARSTYQSNATANNAAVVVSSVYLLANLRMLDQDNSLALYDAMINSGLWNQIKGTISYFKNGTVSKTYDRLEANNSAAKNALQEQLYYLQYNWIIQEDGLEKDYPDVYKKYLVNIFMRCDVFKPTIDTVKLNKSSGSSIVSLLFSSLQANTDGYVISEEINGATSEYKFYEFAAEGFSVSNPSKLQSFPKKYKAATFEEVNNGITTTSQYSDEYSLKNPFCTPSISFRNIGTGILINISDKTNPYYDSIVYEVYRTTNPECILNNSYSGFAKIATVKRASENSISSTTTTYIDENVKDGNTYFYYVKSIIDFGTSSINNKSKIGFISKTEITPFSNVEVTNKPQKNILKSKRVFASNSSNRITNNFAGYNNGITLTWQYSENVASVEVLRRYAEIDEFVSIGATDGNSFTDLNAASNTDYVYLLCAYDSTGCMIGQSEEIPAYWTKFAIVLPDAVLENAGSIQLTATETVSQWSSSDESIASVNSDGTVTAKKCGTVTITATNSAGAEDSINLAVTDKYSGHDFDEGKITKKATCLTEGEITYSCRYCDCTMTAKTAKGGHSWNSGVVTKAATCKATGIKTFTCSVCKTTKTEVIKKSDHQWDGGKVTTAPTSEKDGVKTFTCTVCKGTKTESIPKLEKDYILGDVDGNGYIEAADARLALRASVGLETLSDEQTVIADVDGSGEVESDDARLILRASVGLEDPETWKKA